jgi:hypothetical protein
LVLGATSWVGAGQVDKADELFRQLNEVAPKLTEARLAGFWLAINEDYVARAGIIEDCCTKAKHFLNVDQTN